MHSSTPANLISVREKKMPKADTYPLPFRTSDSFALFLPSPTLPQAQGLPQVMPAPLCEAGDILLQMSSQKDTPTDQEIDGVRHFYLNGNEGADPVSLLLSQPRELYRLKAALKSKKGKGYLITFPLSPQAEILAKTLGLQCWGKASSNHFLRNTFYGRSLAASLGIPLSEGRQAKNKEELLSAMAELRKLGIKDQVIRTETPTNTGEVKLLRNLPEVRIMKEFPLLGEIEQWLAKPSDAKEWMVEAMLKESKRIGCHLSISADGQIAKEGSWEYLQPSPGQIRAVRSLHMDEDVRDKFHDYLCGLGKALFARGQWGSFYMAFKWIGRRLLLFQEMRSGIPHMALPFEVYKKMRGEKGHFLFQYISPSDPVAFQAFLIHLKKSAYTYTLRPSIPAWVYPMQQEVSHVKIPLLIMARSKEDCETIYRQIKRDSLL